MTVFETVFFELFFPLIKVSGESSVLNLYIFKGEISDVLISL